MTYFIERNVSEIKKDYTNFLTDVTSPQLYEGLKSIYDDSKKMYEEIQEKAKIDPNIQQVSLLKIFQKNLKSVPELNNHIIKEETERIKNGSRCYDWYDNLVKATVKSTILLLVMNKNKEIQSLDKSYYENINIEDFVHKCYIECAKTFYNNPYLFMDELKPMEIKKNQIEIIDTIKTCIKNAIMKLLPMNIILKDFLDSDIFEYVSDIPYTKINDFQNRVNYDMMGGNNYDNDDNQFEEIDDMEEHQELNYSEYQNKINEKLKNFKDSIDNISGGNKHSEKEQNSFSESEHNKIDSEQNNDSEDEYSETSAENKYTTSDTQKSINNLNEDIDNNIIREPVKQSGNSKVSLLDIIKPDKNEPINNKNEIINKENIDDKQENNILKQETKDIDKLKFFANYLD